MIPVQSGYYDAVPCEDILILTELSLTSICLTQIFLKHRKDIRKRFKVSSSWCHLAARVVAKVFEDKKLTVVDGRVYDISLDHEERAGVNHTIHSWCRTSNGAILDVAPVGVVAFMPILLAKGEDVAVTKFGFVSARYQETKAVDAEVKSIIASSKYQEAFPVYVSLLRQARLHARRSFRIN